MASIVLELQQKAMYQQGSVSDLLRIAYAVARKLRVDKFTSWAKQELDGYQSVDKDLIPQYRTVRGQLRAFNPYRGWIPAVIPDDGLSKLVESTQLFEPVPEIEHILSNNNGIIQKTLPHVASTTLSKYFKMDTQFSLILERSALEGILQDIRQNVLDWALRLEEEGILGDGVKFSDEEKQAAQEHSSQLNITAPGAHIQVQQNTSHSSQTMQTHQIDIQRVQALAEQIRTNLDQTGLRENDKGEVLRELEVLSEQIHSTSPHPGSISKSFAFIKSVLERAVGSLVASGLLYEIDKLH
ncbi:hypothetical protein [Alicyclobacillus fodiniaquatilis]|uniref:AbiTii domain-containing protein n=1 Tax=Alicyclobacillus fodiniaquatilis TaxID=1661150 RepID=A0ABW4JF67_9BACL